MIEYQSIVYKITTTVDGGWRITFDLPASEGDAVMELSKHMQENLWTKIQTEEDRFHDERRDN